MKRQLWVTGGARGIGREIVRQALAGGYRVAVFDADGGALNQLGGVGAPDDLYLFKGDLARPEDLERFAGESLSALGGVYGLVNNGAEMIRRPPEEVTPAEWNRILAVNLTAPFLLSRLVAPHMRSTGGCIVNIASTRALMSERNTEAYSASKGGLVALTHALAMSLGPEVRVNAVSPGWIDTAGEPLTEADHAQHPVGRVGTPEDVASLVLYLLSDKAGFVTGQNWVTDGGMTRKMIYT